jgi:hypothetical protein
MKPVSTMQYLSWSRFSKPTNDRIAYRTIKKHKFRSLVEIGMGDGVRCERMIRVAQKYSEAAKIRYTGVDLFEARDESQPKLKLIEMHRRLNGLGAKAQLVPGSFVDALQRIANAHLRTDLIIVQCETADDVFENPEFANAWKFLPRMLHASSQVLLFFPGDQYDVFNFLDVEERVRSMETAANTKRAA